MGRAGWLLRGRSRRPPLRPAGGSSCATSGSASAHNRTAAAAPQPSRNFDAAISLPAGMSYWGLPRCSLEPAPSFLPVDAIVTDRALACLLPSLASVPSTITSSPTFMVFLVQPLRSKPFGGPISRAQLVMFPRVVGYVQVEVNVWIHPLHFGDDPFQRHRLFAVVFGGEGMMRRQRRYRQERTKNHG